MRERLCSVRRGPSSRAFLRRFGLVDSRVEKGQATACPIECEGKMCSKPMHIVSVDQWLLDASNDGHANASQGIMVLCTYYGGEWEHGIVGVDVGGVLGCLLDSLHLGLAPGMIEWTDNNGLFEYDVLGSGQRRLRRD